MTRWTLRFFTRIPVLRSGRRTGAPVALASVLVAAIAGCGAPPQAVAPDLPAQLGDRAFWDMVTSYSEPGGFFRSDNFVSNEVTYQLLRIAPPGGVYIGVGPDQNFTYLVALKPRIAFIVDIRRQNMLQHLMYKALIEMSADRAEFLSLLFARPRPPGLGANSTAGALFDAFASVPPDSMRFWRTLDSVRTRLIGKHGFALSSDDLNTLAYVYRAFAETGPDITYTFESGGGPMYGMRRMPTYAELMVESDEAGVARSYLASEENFQILKDLEVTNRIVPLVGDFAGDKALVSVGRYLRAHHATVSAFYTSNVEQYLFRGGDAWQRFYTSVSTLPTDQSSTFIRAVFNYTGYWTRDPRQGPRSVTMLQPIHELTLAFSRGRVRSYYEVIGMSK
jgi:hypothetical protein